jgi:Protein of unknown function (DUF1501)
MPSKCDCGLVPNTIWNRRDLLRIGSLGALGVSLGDLFAATDGAGAKDERSVILLWCSGGPPHLDTFDMKPDAPQDIRGPFKEIKTNVPGMTICEHLPRIANVTDKHCVVRSMTSSIIDHEPGIAYVLTGYKQLQSLEFPSMGSVVAKEKGPRNGLPPYVTIPHIFPSYGPGFLGGEYGPFIAGDPNVKDYKVRDLTLPIDTDWNRVNNRKYLLEQLDSQFRNIDNEAEMKTLDVFQQKAYDLMRSRAALKAFAIEEESEATRNLYGRTPVGQGCLLARRLVEAGVRFVTVSKGWLAWDAHSDNFGRTEKLLFPELDLAYSALLTDLEQRGLLGKTLVVLMGEFGRTPAINKAAGRDHWCKAYTGCFAGCGVVGGRNLGATDKTGSEVTDSPFKVEDTVATVYDVMGLDLQKEYQSPIGRPVKLVNGGQVMKQLFG